MARPARRQDPFVERCLGLLLPLGPLRARAMFGGWGIYLEDTMFALVAGDRLFLKVDPETIARFRAAGSRAFRYAGRAKPVEMSYWLAPEGSLESPDALLPWAELALAAASRARRAKTSR